MSITFLGTPRATLGRLGMVGVVALLAGCMEDQGGSLFQSAPGDKTQTSSLGRSTKLVARDVEAPDVFQATEAGLWDGRPSLGGVWVAHPDVTDPERALIRNTANNQFVIGALFKPSLDRPGPRFQVSSDAAAALGMLAGQPVNLNVTALRREEVAAKPDPQAKSETTSETTPASAAAAASVPAPKDVAQAELPPARPAANPAKTPTTVESKAKKAATKPASDSIAQDTEAALAQNATPPDAAADADAKPKKKRRYFWQKKEDGDGTDSAKRDNDRGNLAKDTVTEGAAVASAATAAISQTALPSSSATPQATAAPKTSANVAQTGTDAPKPRAKSVPRLDKPYLQIGIFSVEQNARNTAVAMRQSGIIPTVRKQTSKGKTFWRVVVGPATTADERATLLKKIKAAGFTDAYAVTN